MAEFRWTKRKAQAAKDIAVGELTLEKIARDAGVSVRMVSKWKRQPEFAARVEAHVEDFRKAVRRYAIASVDRRVSYLHDALMRMRQVVAERAEDPAMQGVPGGSTGLLCRNVKGVGRDDDFQLIDLYEVDTGLLREMREHAKQAAQELGQWEERSVVEDKRKAYDEINSPTKL